MNEREALELEGAAAIDAADSRLFELSARLHAEVELAFEEHKAQACQCTLLRDASLQVQAGLGSLATAFRARLASTNPGPTMAFLCEFDGLPVYGTAAGTTWWPRPGSAPHSASPR